MVRRAGWASHGPMDAREYARSRRIFRAFHLEDALRDPEIDSIPILRGARSFLKGHLGDALRWEEELSAGRAAPTDCRSVRHRMLLDEIDGFGTDVWAYQTASRIPDQDEVGRLRWTLIRRVHRIGALLDLSMDGDRGAAGRPAV